MTQRKWDWGYWTAYLNVDGSVSWSNHEHKASTSQSGKEFLAKGPPKVVVEMGNVPASVLAQIKAAVLRASPKS